MPGHDGRLTTEEMNTVVAKFRELEVEKVGGDLICEVCKNNYWIPHGWLLMRGSDSAVDSPTRFRLPTVAFICTNCGNTKSFFAPMMGITPVGRAEHPNEETSETLDKKEAANGG